MYLFYSWYAGWAWAIISEEDDPVASMGTSNRATPTQSMEMAYLKMLAEKNRDWILVGFAQEQKNDIHPK